MNEYLDFIVLIIIIDGKKSKYNFYSLKHCEQLSISSKINFLWKNKNNKSLTLISSKIIEWAWLSKVNRVIKNRKLLWEN